MPQVRQAASGVWIVGSDVTINASVSGSVSVSNFPATQAVSVANGSDVATGNTADVAWTGTGAGTVVALLKALWGKLNGTLTVNGSGVTQPVSGTVSVGNFPATQQVSAVDGGINTIGAQADAAWSGTGNGTLVALLKGVFNRLAKGKTNDAGSLSVTLSSDQFSTSLPVRGTLGSGSVGVSGDTLGNPVRTLEDRANTTTFNNGFALAVAASTWTRFTTVALPASKTITKIILNGPVAAATTLGISLGDTTTFNQKQFVYFAGNQLADGVVLDFPRSAGIDTGTGTTYVWLFCGSAVTLNCYIFYV